MGIVKLIRQPLFWAKFAALLSAFFFTSLCLTKFYSSPGISWPNGQFKCLDLYQHYSAGKIWSDGKTQDLYEGFVLGQEITKEMELESPSRQITPIDHFNYVYSPLIACLASTFTQFSYLHCMIGWQVVSVFSFCLAGWLVLKTIEPRQYYLLLILSWLGFGSFYYGFIPGQNTSISLLIIAAAGYLMKRNVLIPSGVLLSCLFYKPQFLVFIGFIFLICRQWKGMFGLLIGISFWGIVSLSFLGLEIHQHWLNSLLNMESGSQVQPDGLNQSWRGLLISLFGWETNWIGPLSLLLPVACCLVTAFAYHFRLSLFHPTKPYLTIYAAFACASISSPYVGHYDLLLSLPLWSQFFYHQSLPKIQITSLVIFWIGAALSGLSLFFSFPLATLPMTLWFFSSHLIPIKKPASS